MPDPDRRKPPPFLMAAAMIGLLGGALVFVSPYLSSQSDPVHVAELGALSTLKQVVGFEYAFQADLRLDEDGDGQGEFATLAELAPGGPGWSATAAFLTDPAFAAHDPRVGGHRFRIWLPNGPGGACTRGSVSDASREGVAARSRHFVAYAWPERWRRSGRWMLATDERGFLYRSRTAPPEGGPAWDALYAGGWGSATRASWERADR
jgi:hypothetical protein